LQIESLLTYSTQANAEGRIYKIYGKKTGKKIVYGVNYIGIVQIFFVDSENESNYVQKDFPIKFLQQLPKSFYRHWLLSFSHTL